MVHRHASVRDRTRRCTATTLWPTRRLTRRLTRRVRGDAAFVLPSILMRDPENKRILKAVARAVTHGSAEVSVSAADGVAKYLGPQHRKPGAALRGCGGHALKPLGAVRTAAYP